MIIENRRQLAEYFGVGNVVICVRGEIRTHPIDDDYLDQAISNAIFNHTRCGAWARFTSGYTEPETVTKTWLLDIRRTIVGIQLYRARLQSSSHWYRPENFPPALMDALQYDGLERRERKWYITDPQTVALVVDVLKTRTYPQKYFHLEVDMPITQPIEGVCLTLGSIVEGVEQEATPIPLWFPFESTDLDNALEQIEQECDEIWYSTHGCPDCWTYDRAIPEHEKERLWLVGATFVNPICPTCEGEGIII